MNATGVPVLARTRADTGRTSRSAVPIYASTFMSATQSPCTLPGRDRRPHPRRPREAPPAPPPTRRSPAAGLATVPTTRSPAGRSPACRNHPVSTWRGGHQPRRRRLAARHHRPRRTHPNRHGHRRRHRPRPATRAVRDLLWQHERTRNRCRADYRRYISERCSGSGYDLAAELPALREEIRHNRSRVDDHFARLRIRHRHNRADNIPWCEELTFDTPQRKNQ
jgi:hypothetical protein